jgi:hypothetical protein
MPQGIIDLLYRETGKAMSAPEVKAKMNALGFLVIRRSRSAEPCRLWSLLNWRVTTN